MGENSHLRRRMSERGITWDEITEAIANAETRYESPGGHGREVILGSTDNGRRLKVVRETREPHHVITVADRDSDI